MIILWSTGLENVQLNYSSWKMKFLMKLPVLCNKMRYKSLQICWDSRKVILCLSVIISSPLIL
uniref:Uncharacterized protein n=1 Tax=Arundo donax TaxID=35708 RepID=A0A0A8YNT9_ARUDO